MCVCVCVCVHSEKGGGESRRLTEEMQDLSVCHLWFGAARDKGPVGPSRAVVRRVGLWERRARAEQLAGVNQR